MIPFLDLGLPLARRLDPELAHRLALRALSLVPLPAPAADDPRLAVEAFGLRFPNPIGLAAGFDKNAEVPEAALRLGFGFVEVGTLTPRPQAGNPMPRLFRLDADEGLINRLGFNNEGFAAARARLGQRGRAGIVGVNIGANRDATDRIADYVAGVEAFTPLAGYLVVNVSSPNTPGLRDLQARAALDDLLARAIDARNWAGAHRPLLLKIAPDVLLAELDDIVAVARARKVDGMIVSNTTVTRPRGMRSPAAGEHGGLSGRPLFELSTRMVAQTYVRVDGAFPLIGVGGVDSAEAAWSKIRAGASLVQLYTALVHRGFRVVGDIKSGLLERLRGRAPLKAAVGADAASIAASSGL